MDDLPTLIRAELDKLISRLKADDCNLSAVARDAGLSEKTLRRIRDGENTPTLDTIESIWRALNKLYPVSVVCRATPKPEPTPDHASATQERRNPLNALDTIPPRRRITDPAHLRQGPSFTRER